MPSPPSGMQLIKTANVKSSKIQFQFGFHVNWYRCPFEIQAKEKRKGNITDKTKLWLNTSVLRHHDNFCGFFHFWNTQKENDLGTSSFRSSVSLQKAQLRISIILNYDERREKSVGFPSTFLDLTISLLTPYELSHTPCADMIRESDSVLCVVILWIIYFNFSLESKHVSACFWNSVWAPVTWAYIFQQALILRRQHSVLTAFRVWWRERGGGWERSRGEWGGGWVWQRRNPGLSNVIRRRAAGK